MTGNAAHMLRMMMESRATGRCNWEVQLGVQQLRTNVNTEQDPSIQMWPHVFGSIGLFMDSVLWGHMQRSHPCKRGQSDTL